MSLLSDELARYAELEQRCENTPHRDLSALPLEFVNAASDTALAAQPPEMLMVWHRDLCWCLAKLQETETPSAIEIACARLSSLIEEVPRDTVYTYAARAHAQAPATFSGTTQEMHFVLGLQRASKCLLSLTQHAAKLQQTHVTASNVDPFLEQTLELNTIFSDVIKRVDVATFVTSIEPHFKRRMVLGQQFYGPTAAQLPLVTFEALLYGTSAGERLRTHILFQRTYLPKPLRMVVDHALQSPPLLFGAIEADASLLIQKHIARFRRVHIAIARKAFAQQIKPSENAKEILENLLDHSPPLEPNR